jgi:hypothetical protein
MPAAAHAAHELYWVVGTQSNVGKSTIACALIDVLNRAGTPAIGFKPFTSAVLQDMLDARLEWVKTTECGFFGRDAERLAMASPLTSADPAIFDIVGPMSLICYPTPRKAAVARLGSAALGNVRYFRGDKGTQLLNRPDIVEVMWRMGVPFAEAEPLSFEFQDAPRLHPDAIAQAFDFLLGLGPRAMVCEGANSFLPLWTDCVVNHVFAARGEQVMFLPNVNLEVELGRDRRFQGIDDIGPRLNNGRGGLIETLPVAETWRRAEVAEQVVIRLLSRAGMIDPGRLVGERSPLIVVPWR